MIEKETPSLSDNSMNTSSESEPSSISNVDLIGTNFQQRIWTEIARIPYGTISTYKQIAKHVHTKGYRAVGATIGKNPLPIVIPCHRVIGSNLKLVGYAGGIKLKEYLLRLEGIILV